MATITRPRRGRPPKEEAGPTRARLLDAALKLFAERGFDGTTVRQIAKAVGVTDAAIYAHFANKQALFDALMEDAGPPLLDQLGTELASLGETHPAETLPAMFTRLVQRWDRPRVRMFTSMLLRHTPERIHEAIDQVVERLQPAMQAWVAQGWVREDASPELLAWELVAPLATIRLSLLHAGATRTHRSRAKALARAHLEFYVQAHVRDA